MKTTMIKWVVRFVVCKNKNGIIKSIKGAGGLSPRHEDLEFRELEADYAKAWYENFTQELYG